MPSPCGRETAELASAFIRDGYAVLPDVLGERDVVELRSVIDRLPDGEAVRRKQRTYGVRNLLEASPEVCALATRPELWEIVTAILGDGAFATRAVFFNKTPDANWALGWHQDSVISTAARVDTPGFRAWGLKAGVWQVQPPSEILAGMLALRVHLDDCPAANGALRVIPGSHRHGWLDEQIPEWKERVPPVLCEVRLGGIVAMCPLILHASSRAVSPSNRRVIHIEYANRTLPGDLEWNRQLLPSASGDVP